MNRSDLSNPEQQLLLALLGTITAPDTLSLWQTAYTQLCSWDSLRYVGYPVFWIAGSSLM